MSTSARPAVGERVALSEDNTLRLGGPAGRLVRAGSDEEIVALVREADLAGEPVLVLGGGSNLVIADDGFPGTVVQVASRGVTVGPVPAGWAGAQDGSGQGGGEPVLVTVAAGENWDQLVEWTVQEGLAGLECLAGIPGLAGATPIQNVGAYGQEVSQAITAVRVFDRAAGEVSRLTGARCKFGYRTSMFKRAAAGLATGRFVVLDVSFALRRAAPGEPALSAPVSYPELAGRLGVAQGGRVPVDHARAAVLELRRGKGMVLDAGDPDTRSAGSFFTNPVLTAAQFAELSVRAGQRCGPGTLVPHFAAGQTAGDGAVKVPAAWLIERAGFGKGYPAPGPARISTKHTLALTSPGGGTTTDLLTLAREITAGVRTAFGVDLTNEPVLVGVTL